MQIELSAPVAATAAAVITWTGVVLSARRTSRITWQASHVERQYAALTTFVEAAQMVVYLADRPEGPEQVGKLVQSWTAVQLTAPRHLLQHAAYVLDAVREVDIKSSYVEEPPERDTTEHKMTFEQARAELERRCVNMVAAIRTWHERPGPTPWG
ncbi:hypothetical protein ABZZ74_49220 [Streptomyces sp. NPDC006476]|uniref:hypothetical protein n=1 Tax=Streptomyces sp. NPDC006476 TaxID=3157175 RepID=UPI0033B1A997